MTHILHYILFTLVNYFLQNFSCPVIFHPERANKLKNQVSIYVVLTTVIIDSSFFFVFFLFIEIIILFPLQFQTV